jgi:hypothetical protein
MKSLIFLALLSVGCGQSMADHNMPQQTQFNAPSGPVVPFCGTVENATENYELNTIVNCRSFRYGMCKAVILQIDGQDQTIVDCGVR